MKALKQVIENGWDNKKSSGKLLEQATAELTVKDAVIEAAREFMRVNELHDRLKEDEWITAYNALNDALKGEQE